MFENLDNFVSTLQNYLITYINIYTRLVRNILLEVYISCDS